jgi:hypothetical protein
LVGERDLNRTQKGVKVKNACGILQENLHLTAVLSWQKFWARRMWASPFSRTKEKACHFDRFFLCMDVEPKPWVWR